jgi:hypothetical protein
MLHAAGIRARVVQVTDNNDIDREVFDYRPSHVFIEALWVVPEKFAVLRSLHPGVKWIVHLHSDLPFLATEGVALEWIRAYLDLNVVVAFNILRAAAALTELVGQFGRGRNIVLLPNFYPLTKPHKWFDPSRRTPVVDVGCFGAIRPLKNQLVQAVGAMRFAERHRKVLRFHVNSTRCEQNGDQILRNLKALFRGTHHQLVEHGWLTHPDFLDLMEDMDVALAISFTETFCITAADAVSASVPLLCSSELPWASELSIVHRETDSDAIASRMDGLSLEVKNQMNWQNRINLHNHSARARKLWLDYLASA